MAKGSKKYLAALEQVNRDKEYDLKEAIELVKEIDFANFDASIEVAYKLGVDPKQATNNFVVQLSCLTEQVKHNLLLSLQRTSSKRCGRSRC